MRYNPIDNRLFIDNRKKFVAYLEPSSIAFFNSNDEMPRNGDQNFPFRQSSDLFWLTGIDQEQTILVICPNHPVQEYREALFIKRTNEHIAVWEGHKYTKEEAYKVSGIKNIFWFDEFPGLLTVMMHHSNNVYINLNENDRFASEVPYREMRFSNQLKEKFPNHHYKRSGPIISSLRSIKSDIEIDLLGKAIDITDKAFRRTLQFIKPGVMEYEVEAEITHEFIRRCSSGHSYLPIIASSGNACVLHYIENTRQMKDGDLVMMDFGAEYAYYAADLSRTVPVNGRFTKRQKDVYNSVLHVMREATKMLVVGNIIPEYQEEVGKMMEQELIKLGLLKVDEVKKQDPKQPLYKKYFMHGASHFLGLDVHDIGNRYEPIKEGMVFTCEPGIYIPEENLGIRIENDILVTGKGPVDLMKNIPVEIDEIEELMAK